MGKLTRFIDGKLPLYSIIEKLVPIVVGLIGGSFSILLAKVSAWLANISPIEYGAIFFAGLYIALGAYHLLLAAQKKNIILRQATLFVRPGEGNPLESKFDKKIIRITDFFSPFYSPHSNKTFVGCELIGPGNVVFMESTLKDCVLNTCQISIIQGDAHVLNVTAFSKCLFHDTKILGCTIFMTREAYEALPHGMKNKTPIISGTP
jgi:hypothetical protein